MLSTCNMVDVVPTVVVVPTDGSMAGAGAGASDAGAASSADSVDGGDGGGDRVTRLRFWINLASARLTDWLTSTSAGGGGGGGGAWLRSIEASEGAAALGPTLTPRAARAAFSDAPCADRAAFSCEREMLSSKVNRSTSVFR